MITQEMKQGITVRVPIPDEFIGMWCVTVPYGTHGSYDILTFDGMTFDSAEQAQTYLDSEKIDSPYYQIMVITKDYPIWQTRMFICGLSNNT